MLGLVILVIGLGAWTRLVDAGLGCPDWPGCYGALVVPDAQTASLHSPHHPLEGYKAWAEMIHRYAASLLGLAAIALLALGWRIRRREAHQSQTFEGGSGEAKVTDHWGEEARTRFPLAGCWLLLGMLLVQGAFGAFTVTLKLWPQVVTLHLLGGLSVLSLLLLLWLSLRRRAAHLKVTAEQHKAGADAAHIRRQPWLAALAAALLLGQLALGGWTSSNYAGLACEGFPACNGAAWPAMDWGEGFHLTQDVGPSYLHGQLHGEARTAIHMAHRGGAVLLGAVLLALYWRQRRHLPARKAAPDNPWRWALGCWLVQAGLGVANVLWWLPLDLALAHTLGAVALTLAMVWAMDRMRQAARLKRASVSQALA
ncbi:COX15/CtaA family protein [uncultured Cobetia sp.]|uniref:COX15/CtaA family protein n=1 Tax=uncultured Cobetia sp. TaxID=410706 RepID=UPI00338F0B17